MTLTVGSLFAGIGGIDLGLERAGMEVVWNSEIDPYACRVLQKHWPTVPNLGDVTEIDWSTVERPDVLCGGYPCTPFSQAGSRRGAADSRHLWPHMLRAVRVLRPRWVLVENVRGHLSLGFGDVLGDLAACGYDAEWDCIPAAAVGAPHRRDRVFVVAYPERGELRDEPVTVTGGVCSALLGDDGPPEPVADPDSAGRAERRGPVPVRPEHGAVEHGGETVADPEVEPVGPGLRTGGPGGVRRGRPGDRGSEGDVADTDLERRERGIDPGGSETVGVPGNEPARSDPAHDAGRWATQPGVGVCTDGLPQGMDRALNGWGPGWEDGIPRVARNIPNRVDQLRVLGNSVVPQVAFYVGALIVEADARA